MITVDQAVAWLRAATNPLHALHSLGVLAAIAPAECHPGWLRAVVSVFGDASAGLREFAASLAAYAPWPQLVPFLGWLADHDPDAQVRNAASLGLRIITAAGGGDRESAAPLAEYFTLDAQGSPASQRLFRRVSAAGARIDAELGNDLLWHETDLPAEPAPGYAAIPADRAVAIAAARAGGGPR